MIQDEEEGRMNSCHVVLSGCSSGGKSTLLAELGRRGFAIVPEPGRRIVEEKLRGDGSALPWVDLKAFANRALSLAANDRHDVPEEAGWVFFDRGLVDAAVALQHATGRTAAGVLTAYRRYHERVFLAPPWPEIFETDGERRHSLAEASAEYDRLLKTYRELDYETVILPKVSVEERADFVLRTLR
tara:strand:- start:1259 stop:1816 length:558 start_codon:yes stop_codon:yes gene_type:complete